MTTSTKIRVSNDRSAFATLWLEPWGEDYGMFANDEFEVIALEPEETFYFHIEYGAKGMKIYAEGDASQVSVYQMERSWRVGTTGERESGNVHGMHNKRLPDASIACVSGRFLY